jgi:hypothetical protein
VDDEDGLDSMSEGGSEGERGGAWRGGGRVAYFK